MLNRRLWAIESWTILSVYLVIVFIFYMEKSAEDNISGAKRFSKVKAQTTIETTKLELLKLFYRIAKNKKAYQFSTHQGIEIIKD